MVVHNSFSDAAFVTARRDKPAVKPLSTSAVALDKQGGQSSRCAGKTDLTHVVEDYFSPPQIQTTCLTCPGHHGDWQDQESAANSVASHPQAAHLSV